MIQTDIKTRINTILNCIKGNSFIAVEDNIFELKDLSTGNNWKSLKESICAFLNTDGGYILGGIKEVEDNKVEGKKFYYKLTGFENNKKNESNLINIQTKTFCDDNDTFLDLTDFISLEYIPFQEKTLALISVKALPDDLKYVKFDGLYHERKLSSDPIISKERIQQQKEYKEQQELSRELLICEEASLKDLSLEKINHFIYLLNQTNYKETIKPNLLKAKPFLERRYFIRNDQITTLGLFVCAEDPFYFLENKVAVDCYFDRNSAISKDKKFLHGTVIYLMEESFRFIWNYIRIGRSVENGGKSTPEYSEELVREVINNAIAHRDYSINKFTTITVEPNQYLEVKNPGFFKERLKITDTQHEIPVRRLIPGIPESKNPKLANILKVFDKLEGQGRGMAALVNATLRNEIDIPYYELRDDQSICLRIPSGKLVDQTMQDWIDGFELYIKNKLQADITEEYKSVLSYFYKSELLNRKRLFTILYSESNNHFDVIDTLLKSGLIEIHSSSQENFPIYIVDRVLTKMDYSDDLIRILGKNMYLSFDERVKHILNITFRYSKYNKKDLKPSEISPQIYRILFGDVVDFTKYETLARSIRKYCNTLTEKEMLTKSSKNTYTFNFEYKPKTPSFDL